MIQKPSANGPWMKGRGFAETSTVRPAGALVFRVADDTERPFYCSSFLFIEPNLQLRALDTDRWVRRGVTGSPAPFVNTGTVVLKGPGV